MLGPAEEVLCEFVGSPPPAQRKMSAPAQPEGAADPAAAGPLWSPGGESSRATPGGVCLESDDDDPAAAARGDRDAPTPPPAYDEAKAAAQVGVVEM